MDVFYTRRRDLKFEALAACAALRSEDLSPALDYFGVPEEMPFLLSSQGAYDLRLNAFLRQLPIAGCRSPQTWKAYANDIACLQRFLDEKRDGLHVLHATHADLSDYKHNRRGGAPANIAASSWNRGLAALEKLYDWGVHAGHIQASPFHFKIAYWSRFSGTGRINTLAEPNDEDEGVKCISMHDYRIFRDVGLDGRVAVGGALDPSFRGRNRKRNLAISDFLLNTGSRITEAVSLLRAEVPRVAESNGPRTMIAVRLAPYVAKRLKGRRIMVSERTLRTHISPYILKDRASAVIIGRERRYGDLVEPILVEEGFIDRCRLLGGGMLNYGRLDARVRRSIFSVDDQGRVIEPAMLFLNEHGMPTTADNVRAVFERASARCRARGYNIDVSPHVLRHTFAVCMLTQLIRVTLRLHKVGSIIDFRSMDPAKELFRTVTLDPVDHVRRLLGHRSVQTTYKYLTFIQEAEEAVLMAFSEWDAALGAAPPVPAGGEEDET